MQFHRPAKLFFVLGSIFITFLLMAEVTGSKWIQLNVGGLAFNLTLGVIPFPITFIVTDLLNEYYGRRGVRYLTLVGMVMIVLAYFLLQIDMHIPAVGNSPVDDHSFKVVFFNTGQVIAGSVIAYLIGQLVDIQIFHLIRKRTQNKLLWLRATGSTIFSQLLDSYVVIFVAYWGQYEFQTLNQISYTNFGYKILIAIGITPLIYASHYAIERYLGEEAHKMAEEALREGKEEIQTYPG
ncbi:VUT family protein [Leptospira langatensis]|uniref:Probable queuosine precursor transporter n=1 Tax=Leptospira langatensis TaxID=2484983 RepID=A0A5F2A033_9LEPT|nr:queuosine precursor transporter [Leptospira langatensis]TGK04147.1 VUT family protein [Leptospira langatensis]TGL43627.1 VUT family protein [Leptospira langatensis]